MTTLDVVWCWEKLLSYCLKDDSLTYEVTPKNKKIGLWKVKNVNVTKTDEYVCCQLIIQEKYTIVMSFILIDSTTDTTEKFKKMKKVINHSLEAGNTVPEVWERAKNDYIIQFTDEILPGFYRKSPEKYHMAFGSIE